MLSNYTTVLSDTVNVSDWSSILIVSPFKVYKQIQNLSSFNERCWVNWRLINKEGKVTKLPYMPNGKLADTTNSLTWSTFEEVNEARDHFDGIGIVFTGLMLGIDIDHCIENGIISPEILKFIENARTYTEFSPSETGLHLYLKLSEPLMLERNKAPRGKGTDYEFYTVGRYFTVTGKEWKSSYPIRTVTSKEALEVLKLSGYPWKNEVTASKQLVATISNPLNVSDEELLQKMFSSKNGDKIKALYSGDISQFNGDDSSADASLCSHIAFWTQKDASRIESLWLASPLGSRSKTQERKDYRDRTIAFAIENCDEVYNPSYATTNNNVVKNPSEEFVTIEIIEELLHKIPADTPKIKLLESLTEVLKKLSKIDKITAEIFVLNNIQQYFKITKVEARNYLTKIKNIKTEEIKRRRKEKEAEDKLPLLIRDIDYREAYASILDIGIVSEEVFKIVTAVIVSSQFRPNPPLWLMFIGVPSSFKTELVGLYSAMDEVYTLDTLTENAFVSGYVNPDGSETQDLLPLLDEKSFIIKDLNTLFSMNQEVVKKILGDLTSIFDGQFEKFTATRGMISYNSLFSMIGCITPSILIKHYNYATQLGPRFFFLRPEELTEEEIQDGFRKSWNEKHRREKVIATRQIVSSYATQLISKIKNTELLPETEEIQKKINNIALFICKARGIAITKKLQFKDAKGNDVDYYDITDWQVEQPWRILNQIKSLLSIICVINGNNTIGDEEIRNIKPVIMSTMPVDRAEVIKVIVSKGCVTAREISAVIHKSPKTIQRTLKELYSLDIVDKYKDPSHNAGKTPWSFYVHEKYASILGITAPTPKSMSLTSRGYSKETSDFDDTEDEEFEDDSIFEVEPINKPPVKEDEPPF